MKKALFNKLLSGIISLGVFTNFNFVSKWCLANDETADEVVGEYDSEFEEDSMAAGEDYRDIKKNSLYGLKTCMSLVSPMLAECTMGNPLVGLVSPISYVPFQCIMSHIERDKVVSLTFKFKDAVFGNEPLPKELPEEDHKYLDTMATVGAYLKEQPNITFSDVLKEGIKSGNNVVEVTAEDVQKAWENLSMFKVGDDPVAASYYSIAIPAFAMNWVLHNFAFTACTTIAESMNS